MMGKRVNFAGRSVISPDPNISTNEVGIPLLIAGKLTFPEPVTSFNVEHLKKLVINGPFKYPGANFIENENGHKIALDQTKESYRSVLAEQLTQGKKTVYRHLRTGDILLVNRQPTLHKPSIMSHKARVLPGEKTIRLHYSNCNSYNADFDGDEMNIHLLQNHIARQEAYTISNTDNQYIVPTSGKPIRGLIQDSIVSAVYLTMKDTFFTKEEYFQLIYSALDAPLNNGTIRKIEVQTPAIIHPKQLWTGKQVITTILKSLVTSRQVDNITCNTSVGVNMEHITKLNAKVWGAGNGLEGAVVVRDNELLTGVLDKNHIGNSENGIVHSFYEIYGSTMAGELLSTFGRLFIHYLQYFHGFTCGVDDVLLKDEYNLKRRRDIENVLAGGLTGLSKFFGFEQFNLEFSNFSNRSVYMRRAPACLEKIKMLPKERTEIEKLIELQNTNIENLFKSNEDDPNSQHLKELREKYYENILKDDAIDSNIDIVVKSSVNAPVSECASTWLNDGLIKKFPKNYFSMMVLSGAKGSLVNHSQITCLLGQQELEGRRVPRMASGRTLPSFEPFDPNPRAGGFISDRFSTGIRPQEFFFHCMAGREGLIDTAVKTSRSGYLQRCLIKHLEQLVVNYDYTVRDVDGNLVQFLYGEDSIDVINTKYLSNFKFLATNYETYHAKYKPENLIGKIDTKTIKKNKAALNKDETMLSTYQPWLYLGSTSDKIYEGMINYMATNKDKLFKEEGDKNVDGKISKTSFKNVVFLKYLNSLIHPGESVGILAAQSIGEPSTQMTLNTFHLAGHGGANMTLGIPRLREILMTSENSIKTPIMTLPVLSTNLDEVKRLARHFEKHNLIDIVKELLIRRSLVIEDKNQTKSRKYHIEIVIEDLKAIEDYFEYSAAAVRRILKLDFVPFLSKYISKYISKSNAKKSIEDLIIKTGKAETNEEEERDHDDKEIEKLKKKKEDESEMSDEEDEADNEKEADEFYKTDHNTGVDGDIEEADIHEEEDDGEENNDDTEAITKEGSDKEEKEKEYGVESRDYIGDGNSIENMRFKRNIFSFQLVIPFTQKTLLLKK